MKNKKKLTNYDLHKVINESIQKLLFESSNNELKDEMNELLNTVVPFIDNLEVLGAKPQFRDYKDDLQQIIGNLKNIMRVWKNVERREFNNFFIPPEGRRREIPNPLSNAKLYDNVGNYHPSKHPMEYTAWDVVEDENGYNFQHKKTKQFLLPKSLPFRAKLSYLWSKTLQEHLPAWEIDGQLYVFGKNGEISKWDDRKGYVRIPQYDHY